MLRLDDIGIGCGFFITEYKLDGQAGVTVRDRLYAD